MHRTASMSDAHLQRDVAMEAERSALAEKSLTQSSKGPGSKAKGGDRPLKLDMYLNAANKYEATRVKKQDSKTRSKINEKVFMSTLFMKYVDTELVEEIFEEGDINLADYADALGVKREEDIENIERDELAKIEAFEQSKKITLDPETGRDVAKSVDDAASHRTVPKSLKTREQMDQSPIAKLSSKTIQRNILAQSLPSISEPLSIRGPYQAYRATKKSWVNVPRDNAEQYNPSTSQKLDVSAGLDDDVSILSGVDGASVLGGGGGQDNNNQDTSVTFQLDAPMEQHLSASEGKPEIVPSGLFDDADSVYLPSISGKSLSLKQDKADRYFGKKARGDFFYAYRDMADAKHKFSKAILTRNKATGEWHNAAPEFKDGSDDENDEGDDEDKDEDKKEQKKGGDDTNMEGRGEQKVNENASQLLGGLRGGTAGSPITDRSPRRTGSPGRDRASPPLWKLAPALTLEDVKNLQHQWRADGVEYMKCMEDLDTTLLQGPAHQYYDYDEDEHTRYHSDYKQQLGIPDDKNYYRTTLYSIELEPKDQSDATDMSKSVDPAIVHKRLKYLGLPALSPLKLKEDAGLGGLEGGGGITSVVTRDDGDEPNEEEKLRLLARAASPRSIYLQACIDRELPPMPALVMRKKMTTVIDLKHFGLGDAMGCAFAEALEHLPLVESVNLCDNSLTDTALYPLIKALSKIPSLRELDLSRNKIDEKASDALSEYLKDPSCPLVKIVLDCSDVDDGECDNFVSCLETNENLREIDLSNNLLGSAETIPGAATGGKAFADFLATSGCRLQSLTLAWNKIRMASANALCASLALNDTLTYLDLSYNGLGQIAGEILGDAISENKSIVKLLLKNNNLNSTACLTLCTGICQNKNIKYLNLDENPIGEAGVSAIMQVPSLIGLRVTISAKNCNIQLRDEKCWYDSSNPCRDYSLDLSRPFERAIAFNLLQVVASHSSYIAVNSSYQEEKPGKKTSPSKSSKSGGNSDGGNSSGAKSFGPKEDLKLINAVLHLDEVHLDDKQQAALHGLKELLAAATNTELGHQLFLEADLDASGELDREELEIVLERLGLTSDPKRVADIFAVFDLDGTGVMQMDEFQDLLKTQAVEAEQRIKELTEVHVLAAQSRPNVKYIPPKSGMLNISVVDGFTTKANFAVMSSSDQDNALTMALNMGNAQLVDYAIRSSKIRFQEGEALFRQMFLESGNQASSAVRILPYMKSSAEAKQLCSKITNDDRKAIAQIKQILGIACKIIFGLRNGYYVLDLSNEYHRVCLSRLFEHSSRFNSYRAMQCMQDDWLAYGSIGDTSQHQNWSCFRNEFFTNKKGQREAIEVTPEGFTPMPRSGVLEFDFACGAIPSPDHVAISDVKLVNVMKNLNLIVEEEGEEDAIPGLSAVPETLQSASTDSVEDNENSANVIAAAPPPTVKGSTQEVLDTLHYWHLEILYDPKYKKVYEGISTATVVQRQGARRAEGNLSVYECSRAKSLEMGLACDEFYDNLDNRRSELRAARTNEVIGVNIDEPEIPTPRSSKASSRTGSKSNSRVSSTTSSPNMSPVGINKKVFKPLVSPTSIQEKASTDEGEKHKEIEEANPSGDMSLYDDNVNSSDRDSPITVPDGNMTDMPLNPTGHVAPNMDKRQQAIEAVKTRLQLMSAHSKVSNAAKASRYAEIIEETFGNIWLDCRQVAMIIRQLPHGLDTLETQHFGSYALSLAVSLYERIIDPFNIEVVLRLFDARDTAAFYARIGYLNVFNPLKPEGTLEMNLSRFEERLVAKMLIYLSVKEPGNNTPQPMFKWKRDMDATPGFEITAPWMTEDGLPIKGNLGITFYSGEGVQLEGCLAFPKLRRSLMQFVLSDETAYTRSVDNQINFESDVEKQERERKNEEMLANAEKYKEFSSKKEKPKLMKAPALVDAHAHYNSAIEVCAEEAVRQVWNKYLKAGIFSKK